jgi:hypothetical protein
MVFIGFSRERKKNKWQLVDQTINQRCKFADKKKQKMVYEERKTP